MPVARNEVSLGMIFNALQRIEDKIEQPYALGANAPSPSKRACRTSTYSTIRRDSVSLRAYAPQSAEPYDRNSTNVDTSTSPAHTAESINSSVLVPHKPVIQYPIRQIAAWPAVRSLLGHSTSSSRSYSYDATRATLLEQNRTALPPPPSLSLNWQAQLHISLVKNLCDKFFATFNLANPILDRKLFSQHTLGVAINSEFGLNVESCLVLVVMALGSLGKKALQEAGFSTPAFVSHDQATRDDGLIFFNEARKRIGLVNCDNSIQSCQYYLLSG